MNERPTPETDAAAANGLFHDQDEPADFARNLERQRDGLADRLETETMRLVACGVVALADTQRSRAEARDMLPEYRSAALSDVERRVDECIELRKQRDDLLDALAELLGQSSLNDTYEPLVAARVRALATIGRVKGGAE